jgi:hypothetical protein
MILTVEIMLIKLSKTRKVQYISALEKYINNISNIYLMDYAEDKNV